MNGEICLVATEDGTHGSCEQALGLTHSIGTSSPANEGAGCSEVGFSSTLGFFTSQASWEFAVHTFLHSFLVDLPIVDEDRKHIAQEM